MALEARLTSIAGTGCAAVACLVKLLAKVMQQAEDAELLRVEGVKSSNHTVLQATTNTAVPAATGSAKAAAPPPPPAPPSAAASATRRLLRLVATTLREVLRGGSVTAGAAVREHGGLELLQSLCWRADKKTSETAIICLLECTFAGRS